MEFNQILEYGNYNAIIDTAQKLYLKEQRKRKRIRIFENIFLVLLAIIAGCNFIAGIVSFAIVFTLYFVLVLIIRHRDNKEALKKLQCRYIYADYLITAPETDYSVTVDESKISISGTDILFKNVISAFLYDTFIVIVDKKNSSAIIKYDFNGRKEIIDKLYKNKVYICSIDENADNLKLAMKQNFKQVLEFMVMVVACIFLWNFSAEARLYPVTDLPNQKYKNYPYKPEESFAYQMSDMITDSHNIGRRLNIYFEYINTEYNTRVNVCYDKEKGTEHTEIYFFDEDKLIYMISAGYPDEKDKKTVAYLHDNTVIYFNDDGSSLCLKQEESQPVKWSDEFMSMMNYNYSVRRYSVVSPGVKNKNSFTFKLKDANIFVPDITYKFKKDEIKFTEKSDTNNRYSTVYFINTTQDVIDSIQQPFEKRQNDINYYGEVKNADFAVLYSSVENFRNMNR